MSSLIARPRFAMADPFDWLERTWPFASEHTIRIEESVDEDGYLLRAELPGFDPEHDIQVTADEGLLTISAKRKAKEGNGKHTEFQYGAFTRTTRLPSGADTNHITATYDNGILQITVPVVPRGRKQEVSIKVAKG